MVKTVGVFKDILELFDRFFVDNFICTADPLAALLSERAK